MNGIQELFDLTGRVAIVTGGAGFLGQQFSEALTEAGASIVVADINQKDASHFAAKLEDKGGKAMGISVDVTDPYSVQSLMEETLKKFGRLDILVNSAALDPKFEGISSEKHATSFEEFSLDSWKEALDVNLTGMFLICQAGGKDHEDLRQRIDHQYMFDLRHNWTRSAVI